MSDLLGLNAKAYYATAVTAAFTSTTVAGATEISNIIDLDADLSLELTDTTTRASNGWKQEQGTLLSAKLSFEMKWLPGDAAFTAIQNAFINKTPIFFAALDQARGTTGAQGPGGNWTVTTFKKSEKLKDIQKVSVELSAQAYNAWYTAA